MSRRRQQRRPRAKAAHVGDPRKVRAVLAQIDLALRWGITTGMGALVDVGLEVAVMTPLHPLAAPLHSAMQATWAEEFPDGNVRRCPHAEDHEPYDVLWTQVLPELTLCRACALEVVSAIRAAGCTRCRRPVTQRRPVLVRVPASDAEGNWLELWAGLCRPCTAVDGAASC